MSFVSREYIGDMEDDPYAKYEVKEQVSTDNGNSDPYEQYLVKDQPVYKYSDKVPSNTPIEHISRKGIAPAVNFIVHAATSLPEFSKFVQTAPLDVANFMLNKMGIETNPEDFEKAKTILKGMGGAGMVPSRESIKEGIKNVTNGYLEPTTPLEGGLQQTGAIGGDIAGFGLANALSTPLKAASTLGISGTTAALEEAGVNPWLAMGGGILSDILIKSGSGLIKHLKDLTQRGLTSKAADIASKSTFLKPENIREGIIEAGERLGISKGEIPLTVSLEKPVVQGIENLVRQSSLAGSSLKNQVKNIEGKTLNVFEEIGNQVSQRQELLPGAVVKEAVTQLKNVEAEGDLIIDSLYKQSEKELPQAAKSTKTQGDKFLSMVENTIKKLSGGSGAPIEDTVVSRLTRLGKDWETKFSNGEIPIRDLIDQKKKFNQIIKYETKGGADKMMKPLNNEVRKIIESYGQSNPKFGNRFKEAEKRFGQSAAEFRKNDFISGLLEGQDPETLLNSARKIKNFNAFRRLMERTPQGKEAFQDLSRYILEDLIGNQIKNPKGGISWAKAGGMMKKAQNREIVREIVGKENFQKLEDISKFSGAVEEGLSKFANTSKSATVAMDVAFLMQIGTKFIANLFSANILGAIKNVASIFTPYMAAKLLSNPKFIDSMIETGRAAKGKDPKKFWDSAINTSKFIASQISEDPNLSEKSPQKPSNS